jgi:hypothetical protein
MTTKTAWIGGSLNGTDSLAWTAAIAGSDLASLANGDTVMGASDITNGTGLDQFCDFELELDLGSALSIPAGANAFVFLCPLLSDNLGGNAVYGDPALGASGGAANAISGAPTLVPWGFISFNGSTGSQSKEYLGGMCSGWLPPGTFRWAVQVNAGNTLSATAANNIAKFRTYDVNLAAT